MLYCPATLSCGIAPSGPRVPREIALRSDFTLLVDVANRQHHGRLWITLQLECRTDKASEPVMDVNDVSVRANFLPVLNERSNCAPKDCRLTKGSVRLASVSSAISAS